MDDACVEHAAARELIAQIQASAPADGMYHAKVNVLSEYPKHRSRFAQSKLPERLP